MAEPPPGTPHSITITSLRDETSKTKIARILAKAARTDQVERIRKRLDSLPWTLTGSASAQTARKLLDVLEAEGATVEILPPLSRDAWTEKSAAPAPIPEKMSAVPGASPAQPEASDVPSIDLEPLTLGGILDRGFTLCRNYFWKLLAIVAIPFVLTLGIIVVALVVLGIVGFTFWQGLGEMSIPLIIITGIVVLIPAVVVLIVVFYLSQGALIYGVSLAYLGREIAVREAYEFVFQRLGRFILTSMLFVLALFGTILVPVVLGLMLFFIFRMIASSGWWSALTWPFLLLIPTYAIPKLLLFDKVVIVEDRAYVDALQRSWDLVSGKAEAPWPKGYWLRLVVLLHVFIFISLAIAILVSPLQLILTAILPESLAIVGSGLGQLLSGIGSLLSDLYISVCMVVFYYDIRNRKEGFDLKMLAELSPQRG